MTLTPERIAEIEVALDNGAHAAWIIKTGDEATELCRLARLGLRVEGAPIGTALWTGIPGYDEMKVVVRYRVPDDWGDKRVALVVVDE